MRISDCSADVCSSDLVFDYPYPKAVLKVDIAEKHGVQEKHSGKAASHKMTMRIRVRNDHSVALRDCSVHVLGYRTTGQWTEIDERLRGGDDGMFRVPEGPIVRRTIDRKRTSLNSSQ